MEPSRYAVGSRNYKRFCQQLKVKYQKRRMMAADISDGSSGNPYYATDKEVERYCAWVDDFDPKTWTQSNRRRLQNAAS